MHLSDMCLALRHTHTSSKRAHARADRSFWHRNAQLKKCLNTITLLTAHPYSNTLHASASSLLSRHPPPRPHPNKDLRCQDLLNCAGYTGQQGARELADLTLLTHLPVWAGSQYETREKLPLITRQQANRRAQRRAWGRAQNDW